MAMEEMKYTHWRENPADHCIIQEKKPMVGALWSVGGGFPGGLVVKNHLPMWET